MYNEGLNSQYATAAGFGLFFWLVVFAFYFYGAFSQYKMAQKCDCKSNAWWSFIPVLNLFLLINMAKKDWWWFVLFLVPVVNIYAIFKIWIDVAHNIGHSTLWGFLAAVPFLNLIAWYVLAFTGSKPVTSHFQSPTQQVEQQHHDHTPTQVG